MFARAFSFISIVMTYLLSKEAIESINCFFAQFEVWKDDLLNFLIGLLEIVMGLTLFVGAFLSLYLIF